MAQYFVKYYIHCEFYKNPLYAEVVVYYDYKASLAVSVYKIFLYNMTATGTIQMVSEKQN